MIAIPPTAPSLPSAGPSAAPTGDPLVAPFGTVPDFLTLFLELATMLQTPGATPAASGTPSFAKKTKDELDPTSVAGAALVNLPNAIPNTGLPTPVNGAAMTITGQPSTIPGLCAPIGPAPATVGAIGGNSVNGVQATPAGEIKVPASVVGSAAAPASAVTPPTDGAEAVATVAEAAQGEPHDATAPLNVTVEPFAAPRTAQLETAVQMVQDLASTPALSAAPLTVTHSANARANDDDVGDTTATPPVHLDASIVKTPDGAHARVENVQAALSVSDQVRDHVAPQLEQLRATGHAEVQMQLHPPELGRVQLHLTIEDGQLNVRFVVQNDAAKSALDQQWEPLRVRFADMGFSLGQFDVRRDNTSSSWQQEPEADEVRSTPRLAGRSYDRSAPSDGLLDVIA